MRRRIHAFTIVELLSVIAVVLLLAALLLPILGRAWGRAKTVVCLSHMRQLSVAWALCANDNDGLLVGPNAGTTSDWVYGWAWNDVSVITSGRLYPYLRATEVYRCPEEPSRFVGYSIPGALGDKPNNDATRQLPNPPCQPAPLRVTLGSLRSTARQAVFVEEGIPASYGSGAGSFNMKSCGGSCSGNSCPSWNSAGDWPAWWRHNNSMNISFADGHSENWKPVDPYSATIQAVGMPYYLDSPDYLRFRDAIYPPPAP